VRDAMRAGAVAAVLSGAPSTAWALATGTDPLGPSLAAGSMLLPEASGRWRLLAAAGVAHTALSLGWAQVLAVAPGRPRRSVIAGAWWGAAGGLAIAALDLGLAHASHSRRLRAVAALPVLPQVADHVAYGAIVGGLLARRS
jgi:CelD/BcsL family acetyltransferase involved in cellulose biosynthesis